MIRLHALALRSEFCLSQESIGLVYCYRLPQSPSRSIAFSARLLGMPDRKKTVYQHRLRTKLQGFIRAREAPIDVNPGQRGRDASAPLLVQRELEHQQPGNSADPHMQVVYSYGFLFRL